MGSPVETSRTASASGDRPFESTAPVPYRCGPVRVLTPGNHRHAPAPEAHAIRLATLRRRVNSPNRPSEQIHSLAYYRTVLLRLSDDDLRPDYIHYILLKHDGLPITDTAENPKPRLRSQNPALSRSR